MTNQRMRKTPRLNRTRNGARARVSLTDSGPHLAFDDSEIAFGNFDHITRQDRSILIRVLGGS
jgi:hypothetical protein